MLDNLDHPGGRGCLRSISLHEGSSSERHEELLCVGLQAGAGGGGDCHLGGGEIVSVAAKVYFGSLREGCRVGRVENGNRRVFKNLLAFFAAIWYID